MSTPDERLRQRFADMPRVLEIFDRIEAEVAAFSGSDSAIWEAVRTLEHDEAELDRRRLNGEITEEQYFALWKALLDRTPHEVQVASMKLIKTFTEALAAPSDATDA